MSKLIEFRGLKPDGQFVYGSLVNNCVGLPNGVGQNTKTWIVTSAFGNGGWFNIRGRSYVKPETVGQFTGQLDCNGVKIFKGDIVHFELDDFDVYFEVAIDSRGCFVARNHLQENDFYFLDDFEYKVIGNIHQNSELLK